MGRENPQTKRFLVQFKKKCIHCGQLILSKISKIGATRCQILRLKYTKFDFCWGSTTDPAGGAYSAPPDSLAVFKGTLRRRIAYIFFGPPGKYILLNIFL